MKIGTRVGLAGDTKVHGTITDVDKSQGKYLVYWDHHSEIWMLDDLLVPLVTAGEHSSAIASIRETARKRAGGAPMRNI